MYLLVGLSVSIPEGDVFCTGVSLLEWLAECSLFVLCAALSL